MTFITTTASPTSDERSQQVLGVDLSSLSVVIVGGVLTTNSFKIIISSA
jgi:hypothetical protein